MFYFDEISGRKILKSDMLDAEHLFTTRETIIQTKDPDLAGIVQKNKKLICEYLKTDKLISPSQTHTAHIEIVSINREYYPDTDSLIVKDKDIAIFLNFADCTPVIIFDEVKKIGAVVHAGWKGTAGRIVQKTIQRMVEDFCCCPGNMTAVIGPAISLCCYNVGKDVLDKLKSTVNDFKGLHEVRNGQIFVDLKGINRQQMTEYGVKKFDVCPYCTSCDNDMFFSYRKENATTNRHSAIIKI